MVIELFTSQGCSSCPPADALLSRLQAQRPDDVLVLAYHVDYWNRLGWTDPFSSAQWTARQKDYAAILRARSLYTPQAVVPGRDHIVGSDAEGLDRLITKYRSTLADAKTTLVIAGLDDARADSATVSVTIQLIHAKVPLDLLLTAVVYQDGLTTEVLAGENSERTLHNDRVVRDLAALIANRDRDGVVRETITLALDPSWPREQLGIAVLLQDPLSRTIITSANHPPKQPLAARE